MMINIWCHDDRQVQKTSVRSSNSSSVRLFLSWIIIPGRRRRTKKKKRQFDPLKTVLLLGVCAGRINRQQQYQEKKKIEPERQGCHKNFKCILETSRSRQPVDTRAAIALLLFPAPTQTCLSLSFYMYKYQALDADMSRHRDVILLRPSQERGLFP